MEVVEDVKTHKVIEPTTTSVLSLFPSFSFPDVLCDPTDLILRKGTPFEVMTVRTAFIDGLLAEVFRSFLQL